ncbi:MAG: LysM peptidoglycan-binding domain-containing protein, partial [Paramuribaculum sp.]
MIKHILISLIAMAAAVAPAMAGIDDLPVTTVGGRSYHYYDVEPKQTIYSICRDLGISKAQLLEANPEVAEKGVKAYQRLLFPVAGSTPDIHVVGERETIYGIASRYGLTPSQLDAWNPGIRDGIRKGDRLIVSDPSANGGAVSEVATSAPQQSSGAAPVEYVVKDKETFYSIAHSHGISVGDLEAANPEVTLLRPGMKLVIPAAGSAASAPAATPSNVVTLPTPSRPEMPTMQLSNPPVAVEAPAEVAEASAVNIA